MKIAPLATPPAAVIEKATVEPGATAGLPAQTRVMRLAELIGSETLTVLEPMSGPSKVAAWAVSVTVPVAAATPDRRQATD